MKKTSRSNKATNKPSTHGPIGRKVLLTAKRHMENKVVELAGWREAKIHTAELQQTVISKEKLLQYDPAHALYVYAQNQLSIIIEHLLMLPELKKLTVRMEELDDMYMPSYPPMSPITGSFFFCFSACDVSTGGAKKETLTTVAIDVSRFLDVDPSLIDLYEKFQQSRAGIYRHEGHSGQHILLRELITNQVFSVYSGSGYQGSPGELWYTRLLPPPVAQPGFDYHVAFTTPYILRDSEAAWLACLERLLPQTKLDDPVAAYEYLMKYGLGKNYWSEFVFQAYSNYRENAIFLSGFPDKPETLPHA